MSLRQIRRPLAVLVIALAVLFFNTPLFAQQIPSVALPDGIERITTVEGISEYRLKSNGLRVLLFPDSSKPTTTVNLTYLVGSRNENYGETGMAHLLEHLSFKGTPRHSNVPKQLNDHGARWNGTTYYDRTNYFETFPATDENLSWALDFEADRMVNSFIAKKDLDSEMTVVRNEYEAGENSPQNILQERVFSTMFLWHNYGKSTIGARSDIEQVPIDRLQAFYRNYYQPDNAYLIVAGRFDEAKTLKLIGEDFGKIPKPSRVIQKTYTVEPTQDGERMVTLRRVGDIQLISAGYHIPAVSHPDAAAVSVLAQVLGDTPAGRLHKALVETKKASAISGNDNTFKEGGMLYFTAEVRQGDPVDAARDALLQTVEDFTKTPPGKEEVERIRSKILSQITLFLNSSDSVGVVLSEFLGAGDWRLLFLTRDRLSAVTPEDVQRVAAAYLKPSNRTLGVFNPTPKPDRADIPAPPDLSAMLKDYKGKAVMKAGEAFDASPANIESRTIRSSAPGGLQMALLPKQTRGGSVSARIILHYGEEQSLMNRSTSARLAAAMLMRGTTKHTRQQLQDEFARLKAQVNVTGGATDTTVSIDTLHENLPEVLRLVAEVLRQPVFSASEFDLLKQEQLAGIEQQRSEPTAIAVTAFRRHLSPYPKGDVRYAETPEEATEDIKASTLEDAKKFYMDFYGASNAELAVVGDFDEKAIGKLATELFQDWKSPRSFVRVPSEYKDVTAINQPLETPDKANAFFLAGLNLALRDDDPDYPALALGNYILGGGPLDSRLASRIRQKEGISYGIGSQLQVGALDRSGVFVTFAIYAPQNVTRLEAAFKEEIARAVKDGFTADEVASAKSGYLQALQVSRAQDNEVVGKLASYLFLKRTLAYDAEFERQIKALTVEQVSAAVRRYIDPSKITIIKAGDFKKK